MIAKEKICGIIGLILSLPIAFLTFSTGALCCFNTTFWSVGTGMLFIVMPILIVLFSITGFAGSFLYVRYPLFSGIMMLVAVAGLLIISPFILFLASMFFLLGGLLVISNFFKEQGKFELKHGMMIAGSIVIVILLFSGILYFISPDPYEGKFLYQVNHWSGDIWGGRIDYEGNYVAWIHTEGDWKEGSKYLCILDVSNEDNPSLVTKEKIESYGHLGQGLPLGPLILGNGVLWKDNSTWYLYNTSSNQKNIVDLDSGIGINKNLVMKGGNGLIVYDLINGNKTDITSKPLYFAIYGENIIYTQVEYGYEIWLYNISSNTTVHLLSNLSYCRDATIDIYENTIVFGDELWICSYNILTGEITKLAEHSRKNMRNAVQYFSNIRIFGDNVIYVEISDEVVGMDDYHQFCKYWVVNISSGKKVELKTAFCIDKEKVVGITVWAGGLYLVDLKELF